MKGRANQAAFLLIALIICCVAVFVVVNLQKETTMEELVEECYKLPTTTTAGDLEKDGFVNLTELQSQSLEEVNNTIFTPGSKRVLKAFTDTGDDLVIWMFERDDDMQVIHMGTEHHVREQYESSCAMRTFFISPDIVETEDGVTEVWLRNRTPATWPDILLYRYK